MIRLRRLVKAIRPDVIHSYTLHTNFPAWVAGKGLTGVVVGSLRNDYWMDRREFGLLRASLSCRFPRHLIANSERAQRAAQAHRSLTAPREVSFVPNAIDLRNYTVAPMPDSTRFEIVGVGRFYPQKAWEDVLHALAVFRESARIPWRFRLFGEGVLGEELRRLCRALSLSQHVEFPGLCKRVPEVIASAHVLALSSRYEGTPNVVLEALASGRAVVATAVGDVPRLVRDGVEGYVVSVGDVRGLADRLLRLANDSELVARFGRAARDRAALEPDPVRLMESTFAVYRKAGWLG
jgi:glycosyltransferase involved in cell wall biosynthesis